MPDANFVKIDLGADVTPLIEEFRQRRNERREDRAAVLSFLDLTMDLALVLGALLDDAFRTLIDYYRTEEIISEPANLDYLITATRDFIRRQDWLPILQECEAIIQAAGGDQRLDRKGDDALRRVLTELSQELDAYLGYFSGGFELETPPSMGTLCQVASAYRKGTESIDSVTGLADQFRNEYPMIRLFQVRRLAATAKWETSSDRLPDRSLRYKLMHMFKKKA